MSIEDATNPVCSPEAAEDARQALIAEMAQRRHVWEVDAETSALVSQRRYPAIVAVRCTVCGVLRDQEAVRLADEERWPDEMRRKWLLEPCKGAFSVALLRESKLELAIRRALGEGG